MVYRLGNWEYSYLYRDSTASTTYSALIYGGWILELKEHLRASVSGESKVGSNFLRAEMNNLHREQVKYFHNVRIFFFAS